MLPSKNMIYRCGLRRERAAQDTVSNTYSKTAVTSAGY